MANERRQQYVAIGSLLDDIFIHRGYVRKIEGEGAEMLTPEQLDEWESVKLRIGQCYETTDDSIPGFVRYDQATWIYAPATCVVRFSEFLFLSSFFSGIFLLIQLNIVFTLYCMNNTRCSLYRLETTANL